MVESLIEARELTRRFGRRTAVDRVSLDVADGEIVALVGPNGSGKTTLLKMLAGFLRPDSGTVRVLGFDPSVDRVAMMRGARFAFAPPAWYEQLTARETLHHLVRQGLAPSSRPTAEKIDQTLDLVGLLDRGDERVRVFSFGMRQRLALAQALLPLPRLLVLDEPNDGLDPLAVVELRNIVLRLRQEQGLSILLASHLLVEVERTVDRMLLLHEGRALYFGAPHDLLADTGRTRIGIHGNHANDALAMETLRRCGVGEVERDGDALVVNATVTLDDARRWLGDAGLTLTSLSPERPTLEQAVINRLRAERGESRASIGSQSESVS